MEWEKVEETEYRFRRCALNALEATRGTTHPNGDGTVFELDEPTRTFLQDEYLGALDLPYKEFTTFVGFPVRSSDSGNRVVLPDGRFVVLAEPVPAVL